MDILEKAMVGVVAVGLILSLLITIRNVSQHHNYKIYDPWLLPVFLAIALQLLEAHTTST
jgi:hypothetical protein